MPCGRQHVRQLGNIPAFLRARVPQRPNEPLGIITELAAYTETAAERRQKGRKIHNHVRNEDLIRELLLIESRLCVTRCRRRLRRHGGVLEDTARQKYAIPKYARCSVSGKVLRAIQFANLGIRVALTADGRLRWLVRRR